MKKDIDTIIRTQGPADIFLFDRQYQGETRIDDGMSIEEAKEIGFTDLMSDRTAE